LTRTRLSTSAMDRQPRRPSRARWLLGCCAISLGVLLSVPQEAQAVCPKKPILESMFTDICWTCIFPIEIGGFEILTAGMQNTPDRVTQTLCNCPDSIIPGITVSFWEPIRLIEIVREPYCFPSLNGLELSQGTIAHAGTYDESPPDNRHGSAFYQVHYLAFPVWQIIGLTVALIQKPLSTTTMGLFPDMSKCFSVGGFDMADMGILYMTELDPLWNDDELGVLLNPEAVLFANPLAQAVCAADCVAASAGFPLDPLFWCAGCWGSMYPFSGTVSDPSGELNTASLLAARSLAKFNREFLEALTTTSLALCGKQYTGFIRKSQYKLQLLYPIPATTGVTDSAQPPPDSSTPRTKIFCCNPLGRSTLIWGTGKSFPVTGEDFVFLVFRKKECCAR